MAMFMPDDPRSWAMRSITGVARAADLQTIMIEDHDLQNPQRPRYAPLHPSQGLRNIPKT